MKKSPRQMAASRHNADDVFDALVGICDAHGGRIMVTDVVAVARDPESPLHQCFEWDDKIAGERYREEQARSLIANVRVRITGEDSPLVRYFIHVPLPNAGHYEPVEIAMNDAATRALILNRALSELRSVEMRYRDFSELQEVWRAVAMIAAE
jgi:hypothetical protein